MNTRHLLITLNFILLFNSCQNDDDDIDILDNDKKTINELVFIDDRDGTNYKYIKVGDNYWMIDNLKFKPESGQYYDYNNDSEKINIYGYLYDYETAKKSCPDGWHIATDEEWKLIETTLGMSKEVSDTDNWRGTDEGGKLKSKTSEWKSPNTGASNELKLAMLPGGYYNSDFDSFINLKIGGYYATSNIEGSYIITRRFWYNKSDIGRFKHSKLDMFSIRCVKDN